MKDVDEPSSSIYPPEKGSKVEMLLTSSFFDRPAEDVAKDLLGAELLINDVGGRIVEVEVYDELDLASNSFCGQTPRSCVMFGPPGRAYVYPIYGLHHCLNLVTGRPGIGSAVLIRALEPTTGITEMFRRRDVGERRLLCAGPGRLTEALGVDRALNGLRLDQRPFTITLGANPLPIVAETRISLTKGKDLKRRFAVQGSNYLSRPVALI